MYTRLSDHESLLLEIEEDMLRLKYCKEQAEEIVRDRGWNEDDEDFWIQVEEETKNQWDQEMEELRERDRRFCMFEEKESAPPHGM